MRISPKISPLRFWSQKVLPLVYDDSLSYYEVLGKVTHKLNELISNIDPIVRDIIEDMGLTPNVRYENVYNVKDYGAKGDGLTDDRAVIQELLNKCLDEGGGCVYLPSGKYIISKTIVVGDNCSLIGSGASSEIYNTDHTPFWGTAVAVVGSNTAVANLKINYYDYSETPIAYGPAWGALGITNCEYEDAVNQHRGPSLPDIENITISNIWCDGFYALQCEPVANIKNVVYRNIFTPNSMNSVVGGTTYSGSTGKLDNVVIENMFTGYLRIQGGGNINRVLVNSVNADYCYISGQDVKVSNCVFKSSLGSTFYGATFAVDSATLMLFGSGVGRMISIENTTVDGGEVEDYAIKCVNGSGVVSMSNVVARYANVANIYMIDNVLAYCSNCRFDITNDSVTNTLKGNCVNTVLNGTETSNEDALLLYRDVTVTCTHTGFVPLHSALPVNCVKNGQMILCSGSLAKSEGNFAEGETICTTSIHPTATCRDFGFLEGAEDERPCIIEWDTTGAIKIKSLVANVTGFNSVSFSLKAF